MCRVFSCVVGRGCLLWPVCSLSKTLLAFSLLHFVLQGKICLLLQVSLDFLLLHSSPLWWKGHLFWVWVLEGLLCLHRTIQLQLLQHYWLGHRLGLLWYWMACLGKKTEMILLFLTLHPSTAFWTLLFVLLLFIHHHFHFILFVRIELLGSSWVKGEELGSISWWEES